MQIDLSGKTAFVTGGSVGIGAAITNMLAECGAHVIFTYFSHQEEAEQVAAEIAAKGFRADPLPLDATDGAAVTETINAAAQRFGGRLDILVNNAGQLIQRVTVSEMPDEHWHKVMDVNVTSTFFCTRAALPHMPQGARIVNMSSLAGRNGGGVGAVAYATAKAAIIGFTRAMAKELAPRGITVNALAPGFIVDTPFHDTFTGRENFTGVINTIPLKRAGVPNDVAGAVLYFVSDLGAWVTGQTAEINGGVWFV